MTAQRWDVDPAADVYVRLDRGRIDVHDPQPLDIPAARRLLTALAEAIRQATVPPEWKAL